jgi:hypothetical protein
MLRNMDNGTGYKVHLVAKMISKLGCNFIAINNAATCHGDVESSNKSCRFMTSSTMNWFNINRNIPIHGVTNNFSVDDNGYTKIYSTEAAFAALKADGSITAWGN